ncbi:hypothetical protein BUALT_Bualt07G0080900 [Buddleja alternifolia]|uniref:Phytocyanin domain-containing protein n=1 Tax=Buddleja alternifolia TaxID=168488 RepID=A0AAV6X8Z6_9LAMI|nr:hypothetical protein BUALT_Bualt07G0080900 [Buddleja alternifolia]
MGRKEVMMYLALMIIMCGVVLSKGEVYKVDWTNNPPVPYKSWTAAHHFHVGDTILLEYNKEFHDVVRVSHKNFNTCNSTAAYARWATGNDSFTIKRPGHFYFICSFPHHCQSGQKLDIRVPPMDHGHGPILSPFPPSAQTPSGPFPPSAQSPSGPVSAPPPLHSHKSGCSSSSLYASFFKYWVFLVAIGLIR